MATATRRPTGAGLTVAERQARLSQTEFRRQCPNPEPGHDEGPMRRHRGVESPQRFAEHERVARAIGNRADLGGRPIGEDALVTLQVEASGRGEIAGASVRIGAAYLPGRSEGP